MAQIVLGLATSHGPQLTVPPELWKLRASADRENPRLWFRGAAYSYDGLASLRAHEDFGRWITPAEQQARFDRCQIAIRTLADVYAEANPDLAVIVGNDQFELFSEENAPAFSVYRGATVENIPKTPEQLAQIPEGARPAEISYCPPERTEYPCHPGLGRHIIDSLIAEGFDVAQSTRLPVGRLGTNSIPHAFGYVYRKVMRDRVVPHVPILVNTHYPPNRPRAGRCLDFGRAVARSIQSWQSDARVAVIASGGLSHYVIDEDLDRSFLAAMEKRDMQWVRTMSEDVFEAGTAEIKNWIPVFGAAVEAGLNMKLVDYVPCYRTEAGTGNALSFVYWKD
jgi:hypothetical protein